MYSLPPRFQNTVFRIRVRSIRYFFLPRIRIRSIQYVFQPRIRIRGIRYVFQPRIRIRVIWYVFQPRIRIRSIRYVSQPRIRIRSILKRILNTARISYLHIIVNTSILRVPPRHQQLQPKDQRRSPSLPSSSSSRPSGCWGTACHISPRMRAYALSGQCNTDNVSQRVKVDNCI